MFIRVTPDIPKIDESYWYSCDENTKGFASITIGSIVRIPLHGRRVRGWVTACAADGQELLTSNSQPLDVSKIKSIIEFVSDGPPPHLVDLAEKLSKYYLSSRVTFLRAVSPTKIARNIQYKDHTRGNKYDPQLVVVDPRADRRQLIHEHIATEGSTIIIAPDSHSRIVTWCSELGLKSIYYRHDDKNKDNPFFRASQNNCVIVGGRAALFAPVTDCQSIIILDDAYEQLSEERSPKWNVSDCAKFAAEQWGIRLTVISSVPSSVTHSLEQVDNRTNDAWPKISLENRNKTDPALGVFTHTIVNALSQALDAGHDAAVILNNTMHARMLVCRTCDTIATCGVCDHPVHQDDSLTEPFVCPTCSTRRPAICLKCGAMTFKKYRRGLSGTADDCRALFSRHRVVEVSKAHEMDNVANETRVPTLYIATEALLHRKQLTDRLACCVFIDIDSMIFRSGMSAFEQTLVIVNRALRVLRKTDVRTPVILATRSPENILLADMVRGDFLANRDRELVLRKQLRLAPFYATAEITSTTAAVDKFIQEVPNDIVDGKRSNAEKTSVLLRAADHVELADKAYDRVSALRANNRCTVSVDVYD